MSSPIPVVRKLFHGTRSSLRRARPGSILILVVALLVLVAIIGTAALSTNTIDRYATGQNNANTQIDLLVEGVKNMAKSVIVSDIKDSAAGAAYYRPAPGLSKTYEHWDMPLMMYLFTDPSDPNIHPPTGADPFAIQMLQAANDAWLSPRYPAMLDPRFGTVPPAGIAQFTFNPNNTGSQILGANPPVWDCIGAPLEAPNGVPSAGQKLFDTPGVFTQNGLLAPATVARGYNYRVTDRTPAQGATAGPVFNVLTPTFITYNVNGQPVTMPAWKFQETVGADEYYYIAGDADGDGIADSGLKRLSVGEVNGLTYFYAVRIIDNGSAINVNTAWSRDHEFLGDLAGTFAMDQRAATGTMPATAVPQITNFFPSNIGLIELLRTSNSSTAADLNTIQGFNGPRTEIGNIDAIRFGGPTVQYMRPTGVVDNQAAGTATRLGGYVFVDKATGASTGSLTDGRTDFAYNTMNELLWYGLGRRLDNPGVVEKQPPAGMQNGQVDTHFRAFSVSDAASIAYHFVLTNPDASKALLETATATATFPANTGQPTTAAQIDSLYWSAGNKIPNAFRLPALPAIGNTFNMYNQKQYPSTLYGVGYWFADNFNWDEEYDFNGNSPVENPQKFRNRRSMLTTYNPVSNQIPTTFGPQAAPLPAYPQSAYTKASVNTATFNDLANAFLGVMTEGPDDPYRIQNTSGAGTPPAWSYPPNQIPKQEDLYVYTGMKFTQPLATDAGPLAANAGDIQSPSEFAPPPDDVHPDRMFRSTIRDNFAGAIGAPATKYDEPTNKMNPSATDSSDSTYFSPKSMRKLRSYLAAANAVSMRYPGHRMLPQRVQAASSGTDPLMAKINGVDTPVDLYTYGAEPQPFITEVYVNTDTNRSAADIDPSQATLTQPNAEPYVAIELFYPYEVGATAQSPTGGIGQPWDMRPYPNFEGWSIGLINRDQAPGVGTRNNGQFNVTIIGKIDQTVTPQHTGAFFDQPTTTDPRYGTYIILENYDDSGSDATSHIHFRPRGSGLPYTGPISANHTAGPTTPPVKSVYIRDLAKAIKRGSLTAAPGIDGGEIVIFRPVQQSAITADLPAYLPPRPIDSFDFTGIANDSLGSNWAYVWHYARQGKIAETGVGEWWSFLYPGRYEGGRGLQAVAQLQARHQGTQMGKYRNPPVDVADPSTSPLLPENGDPFDPILFTATQLLDPPMTLGTHLTVLGGITPQSDDNASPTATYPRTFKTQLLNYDQPGWNPISGGTPANKFPFGGFARNSDIMQIPYFGAYWIAPAVGAGAAMDHDNASPPMPVAIEVNSMSMDSSFCEDTDIWDDEGNPAMLPLAGRETFEQLGRFCPITTVPSQPPNPVYPVPVDDLDPAPGRTYRYCLPEPQYNNSNGQPNPAWRYRWTTRLFDYLTVQDPQTDFLPNVDPAVYTSLGAAKPEPVSNDGSTAPGGGDPNFPTNPLYVPAIPNSENAAPVQGLININTASWRVLSAINWTPYAPSDTTNRDRFQLVVGQDGEFEMQAGANQIDDNLELCKAIEWWRDGKQGATTGNTGSVGPRGPFISIFDLYRVKALRLYYTLLSQSSFAAVDPDDADGDYSPHDLNPLVQAGTISPVDQVRNDFEERYSLLNRVGNLITTRSDCFTVYIVVQGWRNVNDPNKPPELVVQRRAAFIADRSGVTATGGSLKVTNVASE